MQYRLGSNFIEVPAGEFFAALREMAETVRQNADDAKHEFNITWNKYKKTGNARAARDAKEAFRESLNDGHVATELEYMLDTRSGFVAKDDWLRIVTPKRPYKLKDFQYFIDGNMWSIEDSVAIPFFRAGIAAIDQQTPNAWIHKAAKRAKEKSTTKLLSGVHDCATEEIVQRLLERDSPTVGHILVKQALDNGCKIHFVDMLLYNLINRDLRFATKKRSDTGALALYSFDKQGSHILVDCFGYIDDIYVAAMRLVHEAMHAWQYSTYFKLQKYSERARLKGAIGNMIQFRGLMEGQAIAAQYVSGVEMWFNAGIDFAEIERIVGHSVPLSVINLLDKEPEKFLRSDVVSAHVHDRWAFKPQVTKTSPAMLRAFADAVPKLCYRWPDTASAEAITITDLPHIEERFISVPPMPQNHTVEPVRLALL